MRNLTGVQDDDLDQHALTPLINTIQLESYYLRKIEALRLAQQKPPMTVQDLVDLRRIFASYTLAQRVSLARLARDQLLLIQHINF